MFTVVHICFHPCLVLGKDEEWFYKRASEALPDAKMYHFIREEGLMSIAISLSSSEDEIDEGIVDRLINSFASDDSRGAITAIWLRRTYKADRLLYEKISVA